jgi:hypothetical protein
MQSFSSAVPELLAAGIRTLIYAGDVVSFQAFKVHGLGILAITYMRETS